MRIERRYSSESFERECVECIEAQQMRKKKYGWDRWWSIRCCRNGVSNISLSLRHCVRGHVSTLLDIMELRPNDDLTSSLLLSSVHMSLQMSATLRHKSVHLFCGNAREKCAPSRWAWRPQPCYPHPRLQSQNLCVRHWIWTPWLHQPTPCGPL